MMRKLTEAECMYAMEHGEFSPALTGSSKRTAIILTQSWCPQWARMRSYLEIVENTLRDRLLADKKPSEDSSEPKAGASSGAVGDIAILYVGYDKEPWFEEFMAFKEDTFGNREVPYVRYYREGSLSGETNYLSADGFVSRLI